jgi:homoserine kinase
VAFTGRGDRVIARRTAGGGVRVAAVSDPRIPTDPARNTAALAAARVMALAGETDFGIELTIEKGLPLAGGMGGSAASAVAGAVAAAALLGHPTPRETLVEAAVEAEAVVSGRHADNVAPALLGGAVLVLSLCPLHLVPVPVHPSLGLSLVTPAYGVETARARALLPRVVSREDAVAQAAALGALLLGLGRGSGDLIGNAMRDRIAEPARLSLYPGYAEAAAAARDCGAFGATVSGSGPTLVAVAPLERLFAVGEAAVEAYLRAGIEAVAHAAGIDVAGARIVS